ncbi:hypothetical protein P9112_013349 [Eukaryota sp. TZLM1-RC]
MIASVKEVLQIDAKHRYIGVTEDIHPLSALESIPWDYSLPTLVQGRQSYNQQNLCTDIDEFRLNFYKKYPLFKTLPFDNLVIAGGSVQELISDSSSTRYRSSADIDIFVHGLTSKEEGDRRVHKLLDDIRDCIIETERAKYLDNVATILTKANFETKSTDSQNTSQTSFNSRRAPTKFGRNSQQSQEALSEEAKKFKENLIETLSQTLQFKRSGSTIFVTNEDFDKQFPGCPSSFYLPHLEQYRTKNSITIRVDALIIQVILRLYSSISELLHGFDLGSSSVAFDGSNVWLTSLGLLSVGRRINVVDTARRSTTFEARLKKYFQRGFAIVLPNLDMAKIPTRNHKWGVPEVVDLPYLTFSTNSIDGNAIRVGCFHRNQFSDVMEEEDGDCDYSITHLNNFRAAHLNVSNLVRGKDNFYWISEGYDDSVITKGPHITIGMINNIFRNLRGNIYNQGKLNTKSIFELINIKTLPEICDVLFKEGNCQSQRRQYLMDIIDQQLAVTIEMYKEKFENADFTSLNWILEDPQTQLTSSINPIIQKPEEYYGQYFKAKF